MAERKKKKTDSGRTPANEHRDTEFERQRAEGEYAAAPTDLLTPSGEPQREGFGGDTGELGTRERALDQRITYGTLHEESQARADADEAAGRERGGPSPYDLAPDAQPESRVIRKGEREQPGPTADELRGRSAESDEATGDR